MLIGVEAGQEFQFGQGGEQPGFRGAEIEEIRQGIFGRRNAEGTVADLFITENRVWRHGAVAGRVGRGARPRRRAADRGGPARAGQGLTAG